MPLPVLVLALIALSPLLVAQDDAPPSAIHVLPTAAGDGDGRDWANARGGDELQALLAAAAPGTTVRVGSGEYGDRWLQLATGGAGPTAPTRLVGVDTGGGLPRFSSDFDRDRPAETGSRWLELRPGVGHVEIGGIRLEGYRYGIVLAGRNHHVRIVDVDMRRSRDCIILDGGATAGDPDSYTRDVLIRGCDFTHYTKRGIRIRGGNRDIRIIDCHADAGGREWATERFAIGFAISGGEDGVTDHDITFIDCSARNHVDPNGDDYWNADGYTAERHTHGITYLRCAAFDNTDGGWDVKASDVLFVDCVAARNKRNYRVWSAPGPAHFVNCVAANAVHYGGSGNRNGIHATRGAYVLAEGCTLVDNGTGADADGEAGDGTLIELRDCILVESAGGAFTAAEDGCSVALDGGLAWRPGEDGDPRLIRPDDGWDGDTSGGAYASRSRPDLGFRPRAPVAVDP